MSDKPEEQQQAQGTRKHQPSFEEVLQGVSVEEPKAPPAPKKSAQPTFEEILEAAAQPASEATKAPAPERKSRPPRQKEERKMPIVVRKPTLGAAPSPAATQPAESSPPKPADDPGSVFSQPSPEENADFAALFAETEQQKPGKLRVGQKLSARVAHLGGEVAFLDLGGKGEGIIDLRELRNDTGDLLVQVGETIEGYVLSLSEGNVVVTRSVPKGAGREVVQQALDSRIPVEGLITGQNKGGLEVDLGGLRGFVPASQVDLRFVEDQSQFVGQRLRFRVTEIRGG
ncbi:MAG TPA: S1 RNA-binding domain-containing protein, partial [Thermoanaerobaculia bacterium]|nr:S1 RNA-binding domain-containing protein [Thermoanaerobaculia bacterium]